jgi:4-hydroxybenzoate polyprenyltransferase
LPSELLLSDAAVAAADVPLCVDLDGTLVRSDTLVESLLSLRPSGRQIATLFQALAQGRAAFKAQVASLATVDPVTLPYNKPMVEYVRAERARGRRTVLATAADMRVATAVADHLGLFDEVIASDGALNLKGAAKADALARRFGEAGFAYAGNEAADLAVWDKARSAVLVSAPKAVAARVERTHPIERRFEDGRSSLGALLRALRPHQWVKNLLVGVPVLTGAHNFLDAGVLARAAGAFFAFSFVASAIYVVNDLLDLAADRAHPKKRNRPLASGAVPIGTALAAAAGLLLAGGLLGILFGLLPVLALYVAVAVGYSVWLKERPLVDVFALAALYTLRLFAGGLATGYYVSLWLLGFSGFFFLGLAFLKRVEELTSLERRGGKSAARRGYEPRDKDILQLFGCCSAFIASLVLALYVDSATAVANYGRPALMWGAVPLLLFWQCRLWLSTARGHMHEDPIVYAARDWVSWLVVAGLVLVVASAHLL